MFSYLNKKFVQRRNLFNGFSTNKSKMLCFLEYPFLLRFISTASNSIQVQNSFTVSYLMNSCGLSQEKAISVSKKIQLKTFTNPDSILSLLKTHEFTNTQITKFVEKQPKLLLYNVDQTLKPKFDFLISLGLSCQEVAKLISASPDILTYSLENMIIPSYECLKNIVQTDDKVIAMLKRSTKVLVCNPESKLGPNVATLRAHGVPYSHIVKLLETQPRSFLQTPSRFVEIVEEVKKMGFNPAVNMFCAAIDVLASTTKSSRDAKIGVYKRWGWGEDEIWNAFRTQPRCIMISEKKLMCTMEFLINKLGYDSLLIAKYPVILGYSLKERIIPRTSVIQILASKGLVDKDCNLNTLLVMTEKKFLEKFVSKFEKQVPEVLDVYQVKQK